MPEGSFIREFNDAMIKNPVGSYTVVETAYGYHVLFVVGKTAPVKKVLAAMINVPIEASNETDKAVYAEATRFNSECKSIEAMDSIARKYGQFMRSAQGIDIMSANLQGLSGAREIVRWAYNKKTEKGSMAPQIFSLDGNAYVVAALKDVNEKGYMSLEQAKNLPAVTYAVTRDKKAQVLKEKLALAAEGTGNLYAVYQKIHAEDTNVVYDTVADLTFNSRVYGQGAMEQEVVGAVFGMKQAAVSAPIQGFSGVYMINVLNAQKAEVEGMLYPVKMSMEQNFQQSLQQGVSAALQKLAEIEDNRSFYY
jgi:peptidyl-prolyl cis-trans isomerase D